MDPAHAFTDEEHEGRWIDTWLVAGCPDSAVRKWDAVTGRILDRMSTAAGEVTREPYRLWFLSIRTRAQTQIYITLEIRFPIK